MKFRKHQQKKKNDAFVAHFQLLGLRLGECRSNVIRSAAQAMAVALNTKANNSVKDEFRSNHAVDPYRQFADDSRRAMIAIATYRLLDPRERTDVYERVQLCYPIDREDAESQTLASSSLIGQMTDLSKKMTRQSRSIKAIEGKLQSDNRREAEDSAKTVSLNLSIDERRSIVRLMRKSNESTLRGLSPLGWLKS